jgi:ABC-type Fe3+/spermidine/putrescine transport system ATPase subunit
VRTVHVRLARERPAGPRNVWPARIRRRVFQGDFTQYQVDWDERTLVVRLATGDPFAEDDEIYLAVEPRHCVLLEDEPLRGGPIPPG